MPKPKEQRNEGPGTFVNGNVEGGIRNLFFFGPERRKHSPAPPPIRVPSKSGERGAG